MVKLTMFNLLSRIKKSFTSEVLSEGTDLPEFTMKNQDGETVSSEEMNDALIYFYPKSGTPGCTKEACSFRDRIGEFNDLGVDVYGVSTDSVEKQKQFHDEQDLEFDLLADPEGELSEKFGVLSKKGFPERTSFLIEDGEVVKVFRKVDPVDHVNDVLNYLR